MIVSQPKSDNWIFNETEFQDLIEPIIQRFRPEKIILFGSHADGNQTSDSDLDLLIIVETEEPVMTMAAKISCSISHRIPIDILVRTPWEISQRMMANDFFIKDIIENGKVLYDRSCQ